MKGATLMRGPQPRTCIGGSMASPNDTRLPARFRSKFVVNVETDCWEWIAGQYLKGYGAFYADGRNRYAHRVAYEFLVGPIPAGLEIDHLCRNRACVYPVHMEPVTHRENLLRGTGWSARNARKTHCIHRHEFTPENTYSPPSRPTDRLCRKCRAIVAGKRKRPLSSRGSGVKLTEESVLLIRANPQMPLKVNAAQYGVSLSAISKVIHRRTWRHI